MKVKDLIKRLEKRDPEEEVFQLIIDSDALNHEFVGSTVRSEMPYLMSQQILETLDGAGWDPDEEPSAKAFWDYVRKMSECTLNAKYIGIMPLSLANTVLNHEPKAPTKEETEEFLLKLKEIHIKDTYGPGGGSYILDDIFDSLVPEGHTYFTLDADDYYRIKENSYE
jgi:hypothetical protein